MSITSVQDVILIILIEKIRISNFYLDNLPKEKESNVSKMRNKKINYKKLSRLVSIALRHQPWLYELEVDSEGWVSVSQLLSGLRGENEDWKDLSIDDLKKMIEVSEKKRHEIKGSNIRALYGHSLKDKIVKKAEIPPDILYHGTCPEYIPAILKEGLKPLTRQYVHLSVDKQTAVDVGKRKAPNPVLLKILTVEAIKYGINFYKGNDKVWLADELPFKFIVIEESQSVDNRGI